MKKDSAFAAVRGKTGVTVRSVIFGVGMIVASWFAVRHLVRLRALGYEDSAIGTLRTLVADENKFSEAHPSLGFTCQLADIAGDPAIASGRNGYIFEIGGCRANTATGPKTSYVLTARPLHSDMPAFCSDESGILKADYDGSVIDCVRNGESL